MDRNGVKLIKFGKSCSFEIAEEDLKLLHADDNTVFLNLDKKRPYFR
ncbi:hypothetical protein [Companilactobacillus ginsenosidimutans]|nr:hypothetical protein [Companilactobacillus ginsenosidimutans]